jgi:hypothetical protein
MAAVPIHTRPSRASTAEAVRSYLARRDEWTWTIAAFGMHQLRLKNAFRGCFNGDRARLHVFLPEDPVLDHRVEAAIHSHGALGADSSIISGTMRAIEYDVERADGGEWILRGSLGTTARAMEGMQVDLTPNSIDVKTGMDYRVGFNRLHYVQPQGVVMSLFEEGDCQFDTSVKRADGVEPAAPERPKWSQAYERRMSSLAEDLMREYLSAHAA